MARRHRRELRPAELRCLDCGHRFTARVLQKPHYIGQQAEPVMWTPVGPPGIPCPRCGSHRVDVAKV
jgi:DNA-directed RNA polymerase subunit RPC12/RpoP